DAAVDPVSAAAGLGRLVDPDHHELGVADAQPLPHRVLVGGEHHLAHVVADDGHLAPLGHVPGVDEAAADDVQVLQLQVLGDVASPAEALALLLASAEVGPAEAAAALVARDHRLDTGEARRHVLGVLLGDDHVAPRLLAGVGHRAALA